ncbi:hypothetical protein LXL04_020359 [Taraxacum kok-saghyz]
MGARSLSHCLKCRFFIEFKPKSQSNIPQSLEIEIAIEHTSSIESETSSIAINLGAVVVAPKVPFNSDFSLSILNSNLEREIGEGVAPFDACVQRSMRAEKACKGIVSASVQRIIKWTVKIDLAYFILSYIGVPARCAGDSFIRRMVSFRETERPAIFISEGRLVVYPHNVTLTTYFRLKVSSSKTRQKDSFQIIKQIISLADITYTFFNYFD